MLTIKNYVRVKSLQEAYDLNQSRSNRIIGGMMWLRMANWSVNTAIDLCDLGLDTIEETEDEFRIGAMTSLRALETNEALHRFFGGSIADALKDIVGVQFRNGATLGGSLYGRFGFSDVLSIFLATDSYVELFSRGVIPLSEFAALPYDNDVLIRLIVKKCPGRYVYRSMRNTHTDFPVLTAALSYVETPCPMWRCAIGARPAKAVLITDKNHLLDGPLTEEKAEAFARYVSETVSTSGNLRGSASYRKHLAYVLTKRNLIQMRENPTPLLSQQTN